MPLPAFAHRRLDFPRPGRAVGDYLDLYQVGSPETPGPLLLYVGGAITERQHVERHATEPTPILEQFEAAFATGPLPRLDLLVASSPVGRTDPEAVLDEYEDFFLDEVLPALGGPAPTALAFVGYSFGAHLVTALALGQERARALVTLGGAGIAQAARAAGRALAAELTVVMFHNLGDELPEPATAVGAFEARLKPWVMPARPGGHGFQSYAANGSVAEAFGVALDVLH
jgi:hypothetical protein